MRMLLIVFGGIIFFVIASSLFVALMQKRSWKKQLNGQLSEDQINKMKEFTEKQIDKSRNDLYGSVDAALDKAKADTRLNSFSNVAGPH